MRSEGKGSRRQGASSPELSRTERRAKVRRRRGIVLAGASLGVSVLVLAAWLPASALMSDRHTLSQTSSELGNLQRQNRDLQKKAAALANPAQASQVARQEYQLVKPGDQAYSVLPPSGSHPSGQVAGDPGLEGPVSPGQGGATVPTTAGTPPTSPTRSHSSAQAHKAGSARSLLGRIEQTLEFWH